MGKREYSGSCHCGQVKFKVRLPQYISVQECNCSICGKTGFVHLIVRRENFKLVQGGEELTEYRFNTGTARHLFCNKCGVKAFYIPRSHPQDYSVNLNCVQMDPDIRVSVEKFDGQNWAKNISKLLDTD